MKTLATSHHPPNFHPTPSSTHTGKIFQKSPGSSLLYVLYLIKNSLCFEALYKLHSRIVFTSQNENSTEEAKEWGARSCVPCRERGVSCWANGILKEEPRVGEDGNLWYFKYTHVCLMRSGRGQASIVFILQSSQNTPSIYNSFAGSRTVNLLLLLNPTPHHDDDQSRMS